VDQAEDVLEQDALAGAGGPEQGPVLTALVRAGRIGARYAAELGNMRVTEQIDALESLGRSTTGAVVASSVLILLLDVLLANLLLQQ
jgi:phospholipid/cholesterol/gamma-HCH transport system permease protein